MSEQDPRRGLPSASGGERWFNCSGSFALEAQAPEDAPTDEAIQGDEIHEAKESEDFSELDEEGRTIAEQLTAQENKAVDHWRQETGETGTPKIFVLREERLWIKDRETKQLACSAQLDVLYLGSKSALTQDYKTGYLRVTPAYRNIQARIQAVSVWHEYPRIEHVRAGISAYRFRGYWDPVDYRLPELQQSEREIFFKLWLTQQPEAARVPGPWCKYCRAKGFCPEAAAYSMLPMVPFGPEKHKKSDAVAAVYQLSLQQLAFIRERKAVIQNILDATDERMKTFPPEELASVGWQLAPGGNMRLVPNIQAVWALIHQTGLMTLEDFQRECVKAFAGKIEEALVARIVAKEGGTKTDAKAKAAKIIEPAVEPKPKSPTLKPLKGDKCLPETSE